jgi:glycosyltransferase involved in cell wall biosynthesis
MPALRLLVVSQYFWPETFRVNELVSELTLRGHEVTVLTGTPNYPDGRTYPEYARNPENFTGYSGAQVVRVPLIPRGTSGAQLVMNYLSFVVSGLSVGLWKLRGRKFDAVIVVQLSPVTAALPGLALRHLKGLPLLMWVQDLWPDSLAAVGAIRSKWVLGWIGKLVGFIYRRCDRILVQSNAYVPNIEKYAGTTTPVRYFPGWAEELFDGSLAGVEVAPEVSAFRDTFNIVFAGNIGEAQDFPAILCAAQALRNEGTLRWLIVGDGRAAQWLRAEIIRLGLDSQVIMLGRHPIERMPSFFSVASALLVSLRREPIFALTIPGKVQSYFATGLPILAMLDGEGAMVIEKAQAGLVCPAGSGMELAQCIRRLMSMSPDQRARMGARGRRFCEQEFSRANLVSSLEGWVAEVILERSS